MKNTFKWLILLLIGGSFVLVNCKDDEEVKPDTRTKLELMMNGTWKWTESTCSVPVDIDGKNGASTDLLSQQAACIIDDTYTFAADSTYTGYANTKCGSEAKSYKGDWIFTTSDTKLDWDGDIYDLVELSGAKLVLRYKETVGSSTYTITDTYTH
jgi:hypothetical protein